MTFLASHTLVEQRQFHVLHRRLKSDEVERLEMNPIIMRLRYSAARFSESPLIRVPCKRIFPAVVIIKYSEDIQQSGLTRPRSPHDGDEFAFIDIQVYSLQHMQRLGTEVSFVYVFLVYHHLFMLSFCGVE